MKLLYITSLSGRRVNGFMRSAILAATELGFEFTMACNMDEADMVEYQEDCQHYGIQTVHIDFKRNPLSRKNMVAYRQLLALMQRESFDVLHCNTPIGGLLGRLCALKMKIPYIIYQAHGFHFWKGAPLKNWLLYYSVERLLARYTDLLITINHEDYARARRFRLKKEGKVAFVHGVGVDSKRFASVEAQSSDVKKELGIPEDARLFISVGELNENKNQITAVEAFAQARIENAYYILCGDGNGRKTLERRISELEMEDRILLLGFRRDVPILLKVADVFVFPSKREGLPGALMEAMAAGVPCMASRIRGNVDLLGCDYQYLFDPDNLQEISAKMRKILKEKENLSERLQSKVAPYDVSVVTEELKVLYQSVRTENGEV